MSALNAPQPNDLLTATDVSEWMQIPEGTLAQWRHRRIGPPFIRVGQRHIRYRRSDVADWLDQQVSVA